MKRFFTEENENYTRAGNEACVEMEKGLREVFDKWIAEGYSIRELGLIAHGAAEMVCCEKVVRTGIARRKAKQEACIHENRKKFGDTHRCNDCGKRWQSIPIENVDTGRLRILLRDAKIDPSDLTDDEVAVTYRTLFGNYCIINN